MTTKLNLRHKLGQGISPQQFMEGMKDRTMSLSNIPHTKERFIKTYQEFQWRDEEKRQFFSKLNADKHLKCLILCTDWCPDVIWNVPVLLRIMEQSRIPAEILVMDDHLETMDLFLTHGGRAQPIAVLVRENGDVLARWGARPQYIQNVMDDFKRNNPNREDAEYQKNLDKAYQRIGELYNAGTSYQDVIMDELKDLLCSV